jgi:hypothetical protein
VIHGAAECSLDGARGHALRSLHLGAVAMGQAPDPAPLARRDAGQV